MSVEKYKNKSRKFWSFTALTVIALGLLIVDKFTAEQFIQFIQWVFTAFVAGNVGEHVAKGIKGNS